MALGAPDSSPRYLQGCQQGDGARCFTVVCGGRMRGSRHKLIQAWFRQDMRKTFPPHEGSQAVEQAVQRGCAITVHEADDWIKP